MFQVGENLRVFIALGATDMRRAINGLSIMVEQELGGELFSGDYFVFCNRTKTLVKILYWSRNGFCLWQKRLEKNRFIWPKDDADLLRIRGEELMWLLEGLDFQDAHETLEYSSVT